MVKHHLGKTHYILMNSVLLFDMYAVVIIYLFLSITIFQNILFNQNIFISRLHVSFVSVFITVLGFIFSFLPVHKITFFSYLGKKQTRFFLDIINFFQKYQVFDNK